MDIMLGDDLEGFDLVLTESGDIQLVSTIEEQRVNAIKIALFSHTGWMGSNSFGSQVEQLLRLPITGANRLLLEREITRCLALLVTDGLAKSVQVNVVIIDGRKYELRISLDGERMTEAKQWLEVRE